MDIIIRFECAFAWPHELSHAYHMKMNRVLTSTSRMPVHVAEGEQGICRTTPCGHWRPREEILPVSGDTDW